jgi:methionyl-tRNA synthetase
MFIINTTIPYVNGDPHLGHLLEALVHDTISRYQNRLNPGQVIFSMGADQHGLKIYQKAQQKGLEVQAYVDQETAKFKDLWRTFEITNTCFIETSSAKHRAVAQTIWRLLSEREFIYQKSYEGLYCVGDEAFVTESQLREGGLCPNHDEKPVLMKEQNYFFALSKFQPQIEEFLRSREIKPDFIRQEWLNFCAEGLEDVSISREKKNLPWGVPVPEDDNQVMYVWFEALINYFTAVLDDELVDELIEFPHQRSEIGQKVLTQIRELFPVDFMYLGKDMPRFHLILWIGMLTALDIPLTRRSYVHGFITDGQGRKFSKSLGNGITIQQLLDQFGVDGARFVMLHETNLLDDTKFDMPRVIDAYNANLADNLGNLVVRVTNLIERFCDGVVATDALQEDIDESKPDVTFAKLYKYLDEFNPMAAFRELFVQTEKLNQYLEQTQPWKLAKDPENTDKVADILGFCAQSLAEAGKALSIFLPESGDKVYHTCSAERIVKAEVLFPKIEGRK